jgi:hypothetical protein
MKIIPTFLLVVTFACPIIYGAEEQVASPSSTQLLRVCRMHGDHVTRAQTLIAQGADIYQVPVDSLLGQEQAGEAMIFLSDFLLQPDFQKLIQETTTTLGAGSALFHALLCGNPTIARYIYDKSVSDGRPIRMHSSQPLLLLSAILHQKHSLITLLREVGVDITHSDSAFKKDGSQGTNSIYRLAYDCKKSKSWDKAKSTIMATPEILIPLTTLPRKHDSKKAGEVLTAIVKALVSERQEEATYTLFRDMLA